MAGTWFLAAIASGVSIENPGIRLELFLKDLSNQTGLKLQCPVYFKNEVLVASFQNQSIDIVKTQLARVVNGTWEERKDGWWLIQTTDQQKAERKLMESRRHEMLSYQLDALKALAPKDEWTAKDAEKYWLDYQNSRKRTGEGTWNPAQRRALRLRAPESRFMSQIAASLKPEMFDGDQMRHDSRYYTVRGLPNQIELPIDISAALHQYSNEQQLLKTVANSPVMGTVFGPAAHVEINCDDSEIPLPGVSFFDKNWHYVNSALPSAFLPRNYTAQAESFPVSQEVQNVSALLGQLPIYNPIDEDLDRIKKQPAFIAAMATMQTATKTDPLGILQGRCWIDFARSKGKPLLADLEDETELRRLKFSVPTIEQPEFYVGMARADADGWILGKPCNPLYNRNWRTDRSLIERMAALVNSPNTKALSTYLQIQDVFCYVDTYTTGIPSGEFLEFRGIERQLIFGALGTLTSTQLDDCFKGGAILVSSLPERGQAYVAKMLDLGELNALSNIEKDADGTCPRFCFPKGIAGMRLGAKLTTTQYFSFLEPVPGLEEGDGLGLGAFAKSIKATGGDASPMLKIRFIVSTINELQGGVFLGSKSFVQAMELARKDSPEYTWSTLPESIKRQVLEAMKD